MEKTAEVSEKTESVTRPPIVVVVGHIDHGKTALLDAIRKTSVAEKETGGITQAIGAYQAEYEGKKITFIDTPGHEAFAAMRARGAHVADVAVLVVAADEGVKPQTEEAIRIIRESELPFAVAINKTDKPNADPARVKKELADRSVLVEGFGGTVPVVELSAKTGEGIEHLLETALLLAELEELKTDPAQPGEGVVIESHLDPRRGATATLLVEDGVIRKGGYIVIADQVTPVRIFENFRGEAIDAATASEPIRIAGFRAAPALGERFSVFQTREEAEARRAAPATRVERTAAAAAEGATSVIKIILKADVLGSNEAMEQALAKIGSPELSNRILKSEAGDITETDVKLAQATAHTIVVGFKVKIPPAVKELADRAGVTIVTADIIYDLLDQVKSAMVTIAPVEVRRTNLGRAKILALFREERGKQIVGGRMEQGLIRNGAGFDLIRNQMKIGSGRILQLQSQRKDVEEVPEGNEFGILADADSAIAIGDMLEIFIEEKTTIQL